MSKRGRFRFSFSIPTTLTKSETLIFAYYRTERKDPQTALVYVVDGTQQYLWDNAPHHPSVETHPYHRHYPDGSLQPWDGTLDSALSEIGPFTDQEEKRIYIINLAFILQVAIWRAVEKLIEAFQHLISFKKGQ